MTASNVSGGPRRWNRTGRRKRRTCCELVGRYSSKRYAPPLLAGYRGLACGRVANVERVRLGAALIDPKFYVVVKHSSGHRRRDATSSSGIRMNGRLKRIADIWWALNACELFAMDRAKRRHPRRTRTRRIRELYGLRMEEIRRFKMISNGLGG
jgi:hypothetical protein